jgi:hypothetical protein
MNNYSSLKEGAKATTMNQNSLESKYKEMIEYAKSQGFRTFYQKGKIFYHSSAEFTWDNEMDWKEFFNLAKEEGCTMIAVSHETIDNLSSMKLIKRITNKEKVPLSKNTAKELEELGQYSDKVGALKMFWFKNGAIYSYADETDWFKDTTEKVNELCSKILRGRDRPLSRRKRRVRT